jgi:putative hemolysin
MDDLLFSYADPSTPRLKRQVIRLIERATGQPKLKRIYFENQRHPRPGESFWQAAVRHLALDVEYNRDALAAVPKYGPVVVVANHPYGVLDGLVIGWLVEKVRCDFLILTNAVLNRAPEIHDFVLPVDFAETEQARQTNLRSRARARQQLAQGGCVLVFPAGAVSTAPDKLGRRPAVDAPWGSFTSQLIQRTRATVVPIWFSGQNSRLFQIASHLSQTLRLSLIFREVKNRMGTTLSVAIGEPIPFSAIAHIRDRHQLADRLRQTTYALAPKRPSRVQFYGSWRERRESRGQVERL